MNSRFVIVLVVLMAAARAQPGLPGDELAPCVPRCEDRPVSAMRT